MIRALAAILLWGLPYRPPGLPGDGSVDRLAAIERCRGGFADLGKTSPPSAAALARACADIFREPACAAAMRDPPTDPAEFAGTITRACRAAYCPKLPAPRPKLCAGELPPPSDLLFQWGELQQHIWAFELGVDPKVMAPLFKPVVVAVERDPKPAPVERPTVHVYAKPQSAGRMRVWIDSGKSVVVPFDGAGKAIVALAREARKETPGGASLIITADKNLPYSAVIALLDAFKKQGFSRVTFGVQLSTEDPSP